MGVAQGRHFDTIYTKDGKEQTQKTPKHITQCMIDVFEKKKKQLYLKDYPPDSPT